MLSRNIGIWLIGAFGSVSTTVVLGALLLNRGLIDSTGLITTAPPFSNLDLIPIENLKFGGCDIRNGDLELFARKIIRDTGSLDTSVLDEVSSELKDIESRIKQGSVRNCGSVIEDLGVCSIPRDISIRDEIAAISAEIEQFKTASDLDNIIVVNLASTEPPLEINQIDITIEEFERRLDTNDCRSLRASSIYAYAAIDSGFPFINFTPSNAALSRPLVELAVSKGVPVMGNDGKTGETLVKTALAPMFVSRNLEVMSWQGYNILGNLDGQVLANSENRESKIQTKDKVLAEILGYRPDSLVQINYAPSLSDQKIAWDFIHFKAFMGAKMSMQFVWQGHDSLLAAPLVLDLVRFLDFAAGNGESGVLPHLACFFKSPIDVREQNLHLQYRMLLDYTDKQLTDTGKS